MDDISEYIALNEIKLDRLLICPKIYLNSFQPAGEWPVVPNLGDYYREAKIHFPNTKIISGMVTNFTELNRYNLYNETLLEFHNHHPKLTSPLAPAILLRHLWFPKKYLLKWRHHQLYQRPLHFLYLKRQ